MTAIVHKSKCAMITIVKIILYHHTTWTKCKVIVSYERKAQQTIARGSAKSCSIQANPDLDMWAFIFIIVWMPHNLN